MHNFPSENSTGYYHDNFDFIPPFDYVEKTDDYHVNWKTLNVIPTGPTSSISLMELTYDSGSPTRKLEIEHYRLIVPNMKYYE